jgi:hypothetical protein
LEEANDTARKGALEPPDFDSDGGGDRDRDRDREDDPPAEAFALSEPAFAVPFWQESKTARPVADADGARSRSRRPANAQRLREHAKARKRFEMA